MNLNELKLQAEDSAQYRLHDLGEWLEHSYRPQIFINHCLDCGMQVVVNTSPLPNEIDIGGEAVALTCEGVIT